MQTSDQGYDSILCGGQVVDGSGNPWFRADVGIKSGLIAAVGHLSAAEGWQRIDVAGRVVCPGFIDIHNHSDLSLLARPEADSHVRQGVTTMVIGNCGESAAPLTAGASGLAGFLDEEGLLRAITAQGRRWTRFGEYVEVVESRHCATNVAALVGHGNVRNVVLGWEKRAPDAGELERMEGLVAEAMEAGAFGLSFGLLYPPGFFAQRDELVALNRVVGRYGGFHSIHMRDERDPERYRASVLEGIEIGEQAGIPAHISHIEAHYPNWGMQAEMLGLLESARARGMDVTCDVPPYLLSSSALSITVPDWAMDGGFDSLLDRLRDRNTREQIRDWILAQKPFGARFILDGHWDKAWLGASMAHPEYSGKSMVEIAAMRRVEPSFDVIFDLFLEEGQDMPAHAQLHDEEEMRILVAHPLSMIETDAAVSVSDMGKTNPRGFGSFPLVFRKYVRGEDRVDEPIERGKKILTLAEAVRKMTSFPAQRLGLRDRGLVREGMWADLVVFDPQTISDQATYVNPCQYPTGIDYVLVNGQAVVERGRHTGAMPGHVLRHRG